MQLNTLLSFVLPLRNEIDQFEETIDSLLTQDLRCQIIVIDDASTDGTFEKLVEKYGDKVTIVRNEEHMGTAFSRNVGNTLVTTPYIAVCDSDLYYHSRARKLLDAIALDPDVDVFHTACDVYKKGRGKTSHGVGTTDRFFDDVSTCRTIPVIHPTACYKRTVAIQHPYLEISKETDCFDYFFMRLLKMGCKFKAIPKPTMLKYSGTTKRDKQGCEAIRLKHYTEFGIPYTMKEK